MDWINEKPRQTGNRTKLKIAAALASAVAVSMVGLAIAQQKSNATGKAQVIERRGPEVPLVANGGGQVVVLFPQGMQGGGGQPGEGDVEIVMVERQQAAAAEGQPAAAPSATGREILFSSRDANEGIVRYTIDPGGNARQMMVLARVGGKYVEARQSGGGEGVMVFTVQQPQKEQAPDAAAQAAAAAAAGGAQGGAAGGQAGGAAGGGAGASGGAAGGSGGGAGGGAAGGAAGGDAAQGAAGGAGAAGGTGAAGAPGAAGATPAAAPATPPPPAQAAVILIYTGAAAR